MTLVFLTNPLSIEKFLMSHNAVKGANFDIRPLMWHSWGTTMRDVIQDGGMNLFFCLDKKKKSSIRMKRKKERVSVVAHF